MSTGEPSLLTQTTEVINDIALLVADAEIVMAMFGPPQWGVLLSGTDTLVLDPDSIVGFGFKRDWRISDFPQVSGAFQSYNKVEMPYSARVTMTKGGSVSERTQFLTNLDNVASSLNLYDILTPEAMFLSCNVDHYDLRRTSTNGATLIAVDLWLVQIRETGTAIYSNTKAASGADSVSQGLVQTQSATTQQSSASYQ